VVLEGEVPRVEHVDLRSGEIGRIRVRSGGQKQRVVLPPHDQRRGLLRTEEGLRLGEHGEVVLSLSRAGDLGGG
jgi:hypothetical protein